MAVAAEGPARFRCPEEFCARRFAPGAAFRRETLRGPAKQLLLIRAPATFSPESFTGHTMPLCGSHALKASQPGGIHKVYSLRMSLEDPGSSAHLLIPSGQPDRLICAPPFSGTLSIWERYGDPGTTQPLFPVAGRPAPQAPEGLKQRFFPFGGWPERPPPSSALEKTSRKRSKKRQLQMTEDGGTPRMQPPLKYESWGEGGGPQQLPGGLTEPARGLLGGQTGSGHKQHHLKGEAAMLLAFGASGQLLGQNAQPSSRLEEGLLPEGVEDPERRKRSKKKKQRRKSSMETEELLDPNSRDWQPEQEPQLQVEAGPEGGGGDPAGESALGGCRPKQQQREKAAEGLQDVAAVEDPGDTPRLGSLPEEGLESAKEEAGGELLGCKKKKKRKKKRDKEPLQEPGAERQSLESGSLVPDWDAVGVPLWREAGLEEPLQPGRVAPNQRPKKKKKKKKGEEGCRGRTGWDSAAGT